MTKLQKYQIRITRGTDGLWTVNGYWNVESPYPLKDRWDMDGKPMMFHTRKEALEFAMNQQGIPE